MTQDPSGSTSRVLRTGLAIGGGSLRAAAGAIGIIQALESSPVHIDLVTGNSGGSITAAMYACGLSSTRMQQIAVSVTRRQVYDFHVMDLIRSLGTLRLPMWFMRGEAFEKWFYGIVGDTKMGDTERPLGIVATDIDTGEMVRFTSELTPDVRIVDAVRASISIPGVFRPKVIGERRLVDGGLRSNVPADLAREMGAQFVIACEFGFVGQSSSKIDTFTELVQQSIDIIGHQIMKRILTECADIVIEPQIYDVGLFNFERIPECVRRGRTAGYAANDRIVEAWHRRCAS